MNLFRLSFLLFILKWSTEKGFCSGTLAKNYCLLLFLFFRYMKHLHSNMKWAIRVPGQSEVSHKHAKSWQFPLINSALKSWIQFFQFVIFRSKKDAKLNSLLWKNLFYVTSSSLGSYFKRILALKSPKLLDTTEAKKKKKLIFISCLYQKIWTFLV